MVILKRKVDETVLIGDATSVTVTDIDPDAVRLLVEGQIFGGPNDGERLKTAYEVAREQSIHVGPDVAVALLETGKDWAKLGVLVPRSVSVRRKEMPSAGKIDNARPSEFDD